MLRELPLLSLVEEPKDCLSSYYNWLLSVVKGNNIIYNVFNRKYFR